MKILVADDHDLFREGMRRLVLQLADDVEVLEAHDWPNTLQVVEAYPDLTLALVDLNMPEMKSFEGLEALLARAETIPVVIVSASESLVDMKRVLDSGAMGYIPQKRSSAGHAERPALNISGRLLCAPALGAVAPGREFKQQERSSIWANAQAI